MSGYETSFASGEDEVEKSPQFQHDAFDDLENPSTDPGIEPDGEQAGTTG